MKNLLLTSLAICFLCTLLLLPSRGKSPPSIGIIVPMEHKALKEIVDGFTGQLEGKSYKVLNAQGDPNIQKAIITQLAREGCEILVPIGTSTSQMTLNLAKDKKRTRKLTHRLRSRGAFR